MKRLILILITIFSMAGIAAYSGSLGDLASEEQKRRDSITDSVTIVLKSAPPPVTDVTDKEVPLDEAENDAANQNSDSAEKAEPEENTDFNGNTESYWRGVISDARDRLRQLEYDSTELTSRRNALQLQHDRTNGARRGPIKDEIERTRQSQENIRRDLEQARSELQSLLNEARSSGALPGWIE